MTLRLRVCSVRMRAAGGVLFPPGKAGNVLRGAFGLLLPREAAGEWFSPRGDSSQPSGFADSARPFVLRASHLDGCRFVPGQEFSFAVHLFKTGDEGPQLIEAAFRQAGREGLGAGRGRAELLEVACRNVEVRLDRAVNVSAIEVRFLTPTELKNEGAVAHRPEFPILFARARDRVSRLMTLYGDRPPDLDYTGMGERAVAVKMTACAVHWEDVERRSGRTGQVHPLGGLLGACRYAGNLGEFVPWLEAAQWSGVGRQTVWGKGAIAVTVF
ncbi:MAG: CRISPR system precrRNA processing endoribonuclease RAMP protein Cas6 [Burkholderiales bacterium]|nr:CRISPR system precrRNA processing endoribonuclease RAMP protein Cas6 [Burkholderiales bacterium]